MRKIYCVQLRHAVNPADSTAAARRTSFGLINGEHSLWQLLLARGKCFRAENPDPMPGVQCGLPRFNPAAGLSLYNKAVLSPVVRSTTAPRFTNL